MRSSIYEAFSVLSAVVFRALFKIRKSDGNNHYCKLPKRRTDIVLMIYTQCNCPKFEKLPFCYDLDEMSKNIKITIFAHLEPNILAQR